MLRVFCLTLFVCSSFVATTFAASSADPTDQSQLVSATDADSSQNLTSTTGPEVNATEPTTRLSFCPEGWKFFQGKCLYFSEDSATYDEQAFLCERLNSQPVYGLNKEKFDFIADVATETYTEFLLTLRKRRGYGQHFVWAATGLRGDDIYGTTLEDQEEEYRDYCAAIFPGTQHYETAYCSEEYNFICERNLDCVPGRFGPKCENECHCLGEPCSTEGRAAKCNWGCQPGWFGPACSQPKEKPDVRYFCINSPEEHIGTYVDIHIDTHRINHRSIYAQKVNSTEKGPWCPGTRVKRDPGHEHVTITLPFNDTIKDQMKRGKCVGKEVATNQYEWTLVIQEFAGILMDSDIQVLISCNFNTSETLQRSAKTKPKGIKKFSEKVKLTPETTDVTLSVVDPYTHKVITEAPIGSHVALRVEFGLLQGSLVKGVRPHHCVAKCPHGHAPVKELLGHDGCHAPGSPVSVFQKDKNSTNSIVTPWFPLFTFPKHTEIEFKCGFSLCFHSDECEPGCRKGHDHRKRRSALDMWDDWSPEQDLHDLDWTSSVIRILPDILDSAIQGENAASPPITEKKPEQFPGRYGLFREAAKPRQRHTEKTEQSHTTPTTKGAATATTTPPPTTTTKAAATATTTLPPPTTPTTKAAATATTTPPPPPTTTAAESRLKREAEAMSLLSPITCGILLLMFLLVSMVFLAFHFNLRRTVEDMRQDMLLQYQPRDRTIYHVPSLRADGKVP